MNGHVGVDGYADGEFDEFHWDAFFGTALAGALAVLLFYIAGKVHGEAVGWLVVSGLGLAAFALVVVILSTFWRRFYYLIWWKKMVIRMAGFLSFAAFIAMCGIIAGAIEFVAQLFGGSAGFSLPHGGSTSGGGVPAVDGDGNAYEWSSWQGKWVPKAGALGFGQDRRPVKEGLFGPVAKTGALGSQQYSADGKTLYEPRD